MDEDDLVVEFFGQAVGSASCADSDEAEWPAAVIYVPDMSSPTGWASVRIERRSTAFVRRRVGFHR